MRRKLRVILKICITPGLPLRIRARLYRVAKALRILQVPVDERPMPEPDEEDLRLTEAGLEDLVTHLQEEDEEDMSSWEDGVYPRSEPCPHCGSTLVFVAIHGAIRQWWCESCGKAFMPGVMNITFKAGDIFATKARGPIAWLHQRLFIPRTDRFHFGFISTRTRDGDYEIRESIDKGIALGRLFQHYRGPFAGPSVHLLYQDIEVYRVADPHFAGKAAVEALSKIGHTHYDYVLVARIALNIVKLLLTGKLPPWTASQLDYARDRRFVCTEAVAFGCRQEGHPLVPAGIAPLPSEFKQAELNGRIRRIYKGDLTGRGYLGVLPLIRIKRLTR